MSGGFVCGNLLKLMPKFLNLSKSHMADVIEFLILLCHRYCWLSKTFYKTHISLIELEKHYSL